jgi:hypothetical protein
MAVHVVRLERNGVTGQQEGDKNCRAEPARRHSGFVAQVDSPEIDDSRAIWVAASRSLSAGVGAANQVVNGVTKTNVQKR